MLDISFKLADRSYCHDVNLPRSNLRNAIKSRHAQHMSFVFSYSGVTLQQAEKRLAEAKQELKALKREIETLRYLLADLGGLPVRRDLRDRDRGIYRDWETYKLKGKNWIHQLCDKYDLGPDRLREIYNQQKALREKKKS